MNTKRLLFIIIGILIITISVYWQTNKTGIKYEVGQPIDSLNNIYVYYNGKIGNLSGRNTTNEGYNLGLKYQCVEFVKRYYYKELNHKMPDSYGNAKDFYENGIKDGNKNEKRNLIQYSNPSSSKPKVDDLLVFDSTKFNKYGHVAIISKVFDNKIEIIQQNTGIFGKSREIFEIKRENNNWEINNERIKGWLRKE